MSFRSNNDLNAEDTTEVELFDSSSGCDMSFELSTDNYHNSSPRMTPGPRKLEFGGNNNNSTPGPMNMSYSPPYKRVRALRLLDSPLTPKTIIQKSSSATPLPRSRLFCDKPRAVASAYAKKEDQPAANVNPFTPDGIYSYFFELKFYSNCNFFK